MDYKKDAGFFKSKRELLKIEGITADLYEKIKIYLKVSKKNINIQNYDNYYSKKNKSSVTNSLLKNRLRSRFLQDLQPKGGYLSGKYEGTRVKIYNQFNSKFTTLKYNLEANLTIEKDPGEKNISEALEIFSLNVKRFPDSWNVYDSLGEAYDINGNKKEALKNYRIALSKSPENQKARIEPIIKKLEGN